MRKLSVLLFCLISFIIILGCAEQKAPVETNDKLIGLVEKQLEGLNRVCFSERWKLLTTGRSDSLEIFRKALTNYYFNYDRLKKLRNLRTTQTDDLLKRKIDILYRMMVWQYIESHPDVRKEKESINDLLSVTEKDNVFINSTNNDRLISSFLHPETDSKITNDDVFDKLARLARLRNQIANELGYNSYYSLRLFTDHLENISPDTLYARLERASSVSYDSLIGDLAEEGAYPSCLSALANESISLSLLLKQVLSTDSLLNKAMVTFKDIGFNINKLPIYIKPAAERFDNFEAEYLPVFVPNDIRLVTGSEGGYEVFGTLFDQMGMALYVTHINQDDWLFRYSVVSMWPNVVAGLMNRILNEADWWQSYTSLSKIELDRLQQQRSFQSIVAVRLDLLLANFENQLYLNPGEEAKAIYDKTFEKYLKYPASGNKICRLASLKIVNNPFEFRRQIIAQLISAQIIEYWQRGGETMIKNEAFKYYLVQNYFRFGQREHWDHILKWSTGEELNIEHFLRLNNFIKADR